MSKRGSEDAFPSTGQNSKKMRGPNEISVKFLLPNIVVGALLSRKAAALKRIRTQTCHSKDFILKISGKDQFYPGSNCERMVAIAGPPPMVHRACCLLQDQIIDDPFLVNDPCGVNDMGPRQGQMIIAVSDRAASKIIGSRGAVVKDISGHFNISISITPVKEVVVPDERVVTIVGPSQNVFDALDPIIYQISQQDIHINPEFEYYANYGAKVKEEEVEEGKDDKKQIDDQPNMKEEPQGESVVKDETNENENGTDPCSANENVTEIKEEQVEDKESENNEKAGEALSNAKQDSAKPAEKKNLKDGRWVWQTERNSRSKWVWVENQKNNTHVNHSHGGYRGNRAGGYSSSGRSGRW